MARLRLERRYRNERSDSRRKRGRTARRHSRPIWQESERAGVGNGHVALLDTDRQGSSRFWNEERVGHGNGLSQLEVMGTYGEGYKRVMSDRKPDFTDSVADIPPGDSQEQRTALYTADRLIIPVQPGAADIWTLSLLDVARGRGDGRTSRTRGLDRPEQGLYTPRQP